MALIAICVHSTEANDRLKYTKQCLNSLAETVDLEKHPVYIINNASSKETLDFLMDYKEKHDITLLNLSENVGTAAGINKAIDLRLPNEVVIKMDDDCIVHCANWVEELEDTIRITPNIGILGLKREDVYGDFIKDGRLWWNDDIMGTCTAFNPAMLDKVGYMMQPSVYGFDDVLMSVRSLAAGFRNAFLPHIGITHLDDGLNPYCDWKKKEAGIYMGEISAICEMIKSGKMSYYYDGENL